ncbi:rhomboid family intramembrane serine protease [Natronobeatus ordinarius]|uniref:rhomboid family intramembrane serine protease n=1 Tax=Natronobeatus ordinarius TaxID=2963433 RepID=UPI0020CBB97E|nr:rhomboid family intramembrane serine protease [Natronobeatus ordinarius]
MTRSSGSPILETLVVFLLVALAQFVTGLFGAMGSLFYLSMPVTDDPWTIVTSIYAHGSLGHLLSNSVALVLFGWPVARATTRFRFHTFFIVAGALAGISQVWLMGLLGTVAPVVGASGAIFALLGYLIAANPVSEGVASSVDVPRWLVWLVFVVLAAGITIATASPRAALIAHFTGFLFGLLAGRARLLQVERRPPTDTPSV